MTTPLKTNVNPTGDRVALAPPQKQSENLPLLKMAPQTPGGEGLKDVRIITAINQSVVTGKVVEILRFILEAKGQATRLLTV